MGREQVLVPQNAIQILWLPMIADDTCSCLNRAEQSLGLLEHSSSWDPVTLKLLVVLQVPRW